MIEWTTNNTTSVEPVALQSITNTSTLGAHWHIHMVHTQTLTLQHNITLLLLPPPQIPVPRTHGGPRLPEFFAPHPGGAGDGGGGSPDLERSNVPAGSDQMGLSTNVWLTPFLHVKVYHGSGSVDSPRPPGSLCSGRRPRGKSLKYNLDTCAL